MKLLTSFFAVTALLAVSGPAVAEEATGAAAASSLRLTLYADVDKKFPISADIPDPDQLTNLGSMTVGPDKKGRFTGEPIEENPNLHQIFKSIVYMSWAGELKVPQDGDFFLTVTARERCATDYHVGGQAFVPKVEYLGRKKTWVTTHTFKGTSKGDYVPLEFINFCEPRKKITRFDDRFELEAFFINTGQSVKLTDFRPRNPAP